MPKYFTKLVTKNFTRKISKTNQTYLLKKDFLCHSEHLQETRLLLCSRPLVFLFNCRFTLAIVFSR